MCQSRASCFTALLLLSVAFLPLACRPTSTTVASNFERRILPNGAVELRYSNIDDADPSELTPDLQIGVTDGQQEYMFGDVRGIEAASDGTIYVLDFQAAEIRSYDSSGRYTRNLATKGDGPAELNQANGMQLVGDSVIWVQDHGKGRVLRIDRNGVELPSIGPPVTSYGYIWSGTVDEMGRIWKPYSEPVTREVYSMEAGLHDGLTNLYMTSFDTNNARADTVALGQSRYRSFVTLRSNGRTVSGIPFEPTTHILVDPSGGFWKANSHAYEVARLDSDGDTVLVVSVQKEPLHVTPGDRQRYVEMVSGSAPERRVSAESIAALIGDHKPIIANLIVDDVGQLWVQRSTDTDQPALYDIFQSDGTYVESISMDPAPVPYLRIRIREGKIYALASDSMGIPIITRTTARPARSSAATEVDV